MNRKQRVALATGVALVILTGLFPPYEGVGTWQLLHPGSTWGITSCSRPLVVRLLGGPSETSSPQLAYSRPIAARPLYSRRSCFSWSSSS